MITTGTSMFESPRACEAGSEMQFGGVAEMWSHF
jgi:hypothetical protein